MIVLEQARHPSCTLLHVDCGREPETAEEGVGQVVAVMARSAASLFCVPRQGLGACRDLPQTERITFR